jgi:acyl-CoA thioester hydrolase
MDHQTFGIELEVRDYECDMEGIVNNAVYMNYLEHARHRFIKHKGVDFADLARRGIQLVVIRVEADYLLPLRSGDRFIVTAHIERVSKLRFGFIQEIFKLPEDKPILKAKVIGTSLDANGRPKYFTEVEGLF